jgi:PAS domain S-box-containing protein
MSQAEALDPEAFFSAAVLSNPDVISVSRLEDGSFLQVNQAFLDMTGYKREEVIGKTAAELGIWIEGAERERLVALLTETGRVQDLEVRFRMKDGRIRSFRMSAAKVRIGQSDCISSACRDVTERDEMAERLEKGGFLLERAEEMADIGSWEFDYRAGKVVASRGAYRIYGVEEGEFTVGAIETIPLPEFRPAMDRARDALIREGTPYDIEFKIARRSDGAVRVIRSKARWDPVKQRLFGMIRDVTEAKETEAGLERALAEKETLIKELYHRTKNNMQVISSLLGMEAGRSSLPELGDILDEVQRRIDAMALVHEMLYQSSDLSRIDLGAFVSSLAELLKSSLGDREGRVGFAYDVEGVELLMETAVPCGIILNELVSNALIHAFPAKRRGTIRIAASRGPDGGVTISVRDDGVGAPELEDYGEGGRRLGLYLVSSIGRFQLGGSVDFETGPGGFGCVLRFKDGLDEARV